MTHLLDNHARAALSGGAPQARLPCAGLRRRHATARAFDSESISLDKSAGRGLVALARAWGSSLLDKSRRWDTVRTCARLSFSKFLLPKGDSE